MRPHPRIRKTIKWGGLACTIAALTAWALSVWSPAHLGEWSGTSVLLSEGRVTCYHNPWIAPGVVDLLRTIPLRNRGMLWSFEYEAFPNSTLVVIPLWLPVLFAALPSVLTWRLDTLATRRAKRGACPTCSYSRAGLAPSAPCPECGAAAPQA